MFKHRTTCRKKNHKRHSLSDSQTTLSTRHHHHHHHPHHHPLGCILMIIAHHYGSNRNTRTPWHHHRRASSTVVFSASCFSAIEVGNSEAASEHVALINLFFASRLQRLCWESAAATHVPLQTTIVAPSENQAHACIFCDGHAHQRCSSPWRLLKELPVAVLDLD